MKHIKLKILDSFLKQAIGGDFTLCLNDEADILHLIAKIDVCRKGRFLIKNYPEYQSLLHMTWNPIQEKFYKQIALSAYTKNHEFLEVRKNPRLVLPDGACIFLGLGLCKSESEDILDYETFQKALSESLDLI